MKERKPTLLPGGGAGLGGMKKSEQGNFRQLWVSNRQVQVPSSSPARSSQSTWGFRTVLSLWAPAETHSLGGAPLAIEAAKCQIILAQGWACCWLSCFYSPLPISLWKQIASPGCFWHISGSWPGSLQSGFGFAMQVRKLEKVSCSSHQQGFMLRPRSVPYLHQLLSSSSKQPQEGGTTAPILQ